MTAHPLVARALAAFLLLSYLAARPAEAATIVVNTTVDIVANDGLCTLREAIRAANQNLASGAAAGECAAGLSLGVDEIVFTNLPGSPDVYLLAIPPAGANTITSGDLNITERVRITGNVQLGGAPETIIDANHVDRVIRIAQGVTVTLSSVTIQGGQAPHGAGIANEGGTLTIEKSIVQQNLAFCYGFCAVDGAGIRSFDGTLTVISSTVGNNTAFCDGDGCAVAGAGIVNAGANAGPVDLLNSRVWFNVAHCEGDDCSSTGGGVWNSGAVHGIGAFLFENWAHCEGTSCDAGGGGIFTLTGSVLLDDSRLERNESRCGGLGCDSRGGGVRNQGGIVGIQANSFFFLNTALCVAHGCSASGGGLFHDGEQASVVGSRFAKNTASAVSDNGLARGGAVFNALNARLDVMAAEFAKNSVEGINVPGGGGIINFGVLSVRRSTFSGNFVTGQNAADGGAIANRSTGRLDLINGTLSRNRATCEAADCSSRGGGLFNEGTSDISFATFFGNAVMCEERDCVGTLSNDGAGIFNSTRATVNLKHSIVANNLANKDWPGEDCAGNVNDIFTYGDNFDSDGSCGPAVITNSPLLWLAPLANNGGSTETHALISGSFAIDLAVDCTALDGTPVLVDQRGIARPQEAACDVGAYERAGVHVGLAELSAELERLGEQLGARLQSSVHEIVELLSDSNGRNDKRACGKLTALMNTIQVAERRGELTSTQATQLRRAAEALRNLLSCGG